MLSCTPVPSLVEPLDCEFEFFKIQEIKLEKQKKKSRPDSNKTFTQKKMRCLRRHKTTNPRLSTLIMRYQRNQTNLSPQLEMAFTCKGYTPS